MPARTNPVPLPEAKSYYILFFTLAFPLNICFSVSLSQLPLIYLLSLKKKKSKLT